MSSHLLGGGSDAYDTIGAYNAGVLAHSTAMIPPLPPGLPPPGALIKQQLERGASIGFGGLGSADDFGGRTAGTPSAHQLAEMAGFYAAGELEPVGGLELKPPLDLVARAAAAAATAAEQAARIELLESIELAKAEILDRMEKTDAAIASLEREIAESEDKGENDREQVEEQRTHEDARLRRELEGVRGKVGVAQRSETKLSAAAELKEEEANELKVHADLVVSVAVIVDEEDLKKVDAVGTHCGSGSTGAGAVGSPGITDKAAEAAAKAVQNMLAGREPRRALVKRICDHNKTLAQKSHNGIKTVCGLPLAHEVGGAATCGGSRDLSRPFGGVRGTPEPNLRRRNHRRLMTQPVILPMKPRCGARTTRQRQSDATWFLRSPPWEHSSPRSLVSSLHSRGTLFPTTQTWRGGTSHYRKVTRVTVDEIASRNVLCENEPPRRTAKEVVMRVLAGRRAAVSDKELELAIIYLQRREQWRVRMVRSARQKMEKEAGGVVSASKAGKTPTPGSRSSSRLRPNMAGVVRTDYEEMQVLQELQAQERLKTLVKLPPMILDPVNKIHPTPETLQA
jgi:hypothetical protein